MAVMGILATVTVLLILLCLRVGSQPVDLIDMVHTFAHIIVPDRSQTDVEIGETILLYVRLPRVLLALLIGASLAVVGVALQALLRNPLADPYVLGISSGSALGASLALSIGIGHSLVQQATVPFWAFVGGIAAMAVVYRIALSGGRLPVHTLLLTGIIINAVLSAVILFVTSILDPTKLFRMMSWLMGNVPSPDFATLGILAAYAGVGIVLLLRQAGNLNLLALGEESAMTLGVDVERVKRTVFVLAALLTGAAVSVSGMIGFVGMVVPHMLRMTIGADHRFLLPASALIGGCFLMISDTMARTLFAPSEIPVGIVTALIGGPIFIGLLMTHTARMNV
jgi:cobalamin transport system permease protein